MKSIKIKSMSFAAVLVALVLFCQGMPALAAKPASVTVSSSGTQVTEKVNLNTADSNDLQKIRGIGPKFAERILEYRKEHGRFQSADELVNVRGIGPVKFEKMRDQVTV